MARRRASRKFAEDMSLAGPFDHGIDRLGGALLPPAQADPDQRPLHPPGLLEPESYHFASVFSETATNDISQMPYGGGTIVRADALTGVLSP
jgi:hypothetical protein